MKTIPLKTASELLDKAIFLALASAGQDVEFNSWGFADEEDSDFLLITWTDEDGLIYTVKFIEGDNQTVTIDGDQMLLIDEDGDKQAIGLVFQYANLENSLDNI